MTPETDRVLLLNPPYADYTYPYHSLSYVAAAAGEAGLDAEVHDINAIWFASVFTSERIAEWSGEIDAALASLCETDQLDIDRQHRIADLLRAKSICACLQPETARDILRSPAFHDEQSYAFARRTVRAFEALLSILYQPYNFLTAFSEPPHEANAAALAARAAQSERLRRDFLNILAACTRADDYLFVGVSMPFSANLVPGFCLLDALGEAFPGVPRVAGGTAVTDLVKYQRDHGALAPLREHCEALFAGEAETGLRGLVDWIRNGGPARGTTPAQAIVPGAPVEPAAKKPVYVALRPAEADRGRHRSFDWAAHPPRYDWIDWDLYLAPARGVNYAPVRGCFWNKCTFCDYGLNDDAPTAPSRMMNPDLAVDGVERLAKAGVEYFYLAADALPPSFLRKFATELIARGLDVSWSCQLYLTQTFNDDFIGLLARSGLCAASFGLESGSDAVLSAMGKGENRVEKVLRPALDAFRRSSVTLQPLFFFGFPGETDRDRQATVDLLLEYRDLFAPISKGGAFTLLAGSMIAKDPAAYGLSRLRPPAGDDFAGGLDYDDAGGEGARTCAAFSAFNDQLPHAPFFERPWAGGIDTLHSHLWLRRRGRRAFDALRDVFAEPDGFFPPLSVACRFDLDALMENVAIDRATRAMAALGALDDATRGMLKDVLAPLPVGRETRYRLALKPYSEHVAS